MGEGGCFELFCVMGFVAELGSALCLQVEGLFWGSFGGCFVFCRFEGLNLSRGLRHGVKV